MATLVCPSEAATSRRPAVATLLRRAGTWVTAGRGPSTTGTRPGHPTVFLDAAGFGARANGDRSYLDRPEAGQSSGDPPGP